MQVNSFGGTDLKVSSISFGTSSLAGVFHPVSEAEATNVVRAALDIGINYFDTAPLYGDTLAETRLGLALKGVPRDKFLLASKIGRFHNDEFDFSADRVKRSFEDSCKRLKTDYLDVFQAHDIEFADKQQLLDETLPTLEMLKAQGKVRYIGITGLDVSILNSIASQFDIDSILSFCRGTIFDDRINNLYEQVHDAKLALINASPLVMGLLTDRGPISWHPAKDIMRDIALRANKHCRDKALSLEKFAVQASFQLAKNSPISTTLIGSGVADHVVEWGKWLNEQVDLHAIEEVRNIFQAVMNKDWM